MPLFISWVAGAVKYFYLITVSGGFVFIQLRRQQSVYGLMDYFGTYFSGVDIFSFWLDCFLRGMSGRGGGFSFVRFRASIPCVFCVYL